MPEKSREPQRREPAGFTPHSSGPASERAREQGWQTNEEERTKTPSARQPIDDGRDYDYGARDFGDVPEDTSSAQLPIKPTRTPAESTEKKRRKKAA